MKRFHRSHLNKGFTLQELLIAVAIIAVLAAITIPAVAAAKKNLKYTELCNTAREIYISVQNKLVGEKATGQLTSLEKIASDAYSGQNLKTLNAEPKDYANIAGNEADAWQDLYYMVYDPQNAGENADLHSFLIDDASLEKSVLDGCFIVEFAPSTGDVYSVFYAEKSISYAAVQGLSRDAGTLKNHSPMLGYYGGTLDATSATKLPKKFDTTVKVVNQEELYLDIACDNLINLLTAQKNLKIQITLTDARTGGTAVRTLTGGTDFSITGDSMTFHILLDSMSAHFEDIVTASGTGAGGFKGTIVPGDNITANVKVLFQYKDISIDNGTSGFTTESFSSLFESRTDSGSAMNIGVGYVRHLNNLRSDYFSFSACKDAASALNITQARSIDFLADNYDWTARTYSRAAVSPIKTFAPIVVGSDLNNRTTFDGQNNLISNFTISGSANTGLFSTLTGWKLQNISLVDPTVAGGGNVGSLAGSVSGCTVDGCGAYLATTDENHVLYINQTAGNSDLYANRMEQRRAEHAVTASGNNAGGLIGLVSSGNKTVISNSFAAVDVSASGNAGGLLGKTASACTISSCYASGNVTASGQYAGGLIGSGSKTTASQCYATSNVIAPSGAGGFAGYGGSYSNCNSYGKVTKKDGTTVGTYSGFAGSGASCSGCSYLRQKGYNETYTAQKGVTAKWYSEFSSSIADDSQKTPADPYNINLYTKDKCLLPLPNPTGLTIHHGDWPMEYTIQVALVYYERYTDGDYGLYAVTSISTGDTSGTDDGTRWLLNTLHSNEACMEDGYALMTIYELSKFSYTMNNDKISTNYKGLSGTVTVGKKAGTNAAVKLETESSLTFQKCDQEGNLSGSDSFSAKGLYIYQLPYELQDTQRNGAAAFYDTLKMTSAYAVGSGSLPVMQDYKFYYNPHFAKNAINPDPKGGNDSTCPNDPEYVYVRSARQLHNIGVYRYYWNDENHRGTGTQKFQFLQETDIDFSIYTKTYCGKSYNLMDTSESNPNRNRPIGLQMGHNYDPTGGEYIAGLSANEQPGNFRNIYDGQNHKIINFCVESLAKDKFRFTGLFGEIMKATIKNVVMVATDPAKGYVISRYQDSDECAGVGALVGLVYDETNSNNTTVQNCSVTGYTVKYIGNRYCAVGGLAGYNLGHILNCSAVCRTVQASLTGGVKRINVAGFTAINLKEIRNCYAGGSLSIATSGSASIGQGSSMAGISGKIYATYTKHSTNATISNSYSYCTFSAADSDNVSYYGVGAQGAAANPNTGNGYHCADQSIDGCYYLTDTIRTELMNSLAEAQYPKVYSQISRGLSFEGLYGLNLPGFSKAAYSYPWNTQSGAYPFPAIVKNSAGNTVHYGNWPLQTVAGGVLTYFEQYDDGAYGYAYIDPEGNTESTLDDKKTIQNSGYGYLTTAAIPGSAIRMVVGTAEYTVGSAPETADAVTLSSELIGGQPVTLTCDRLYPFPAEAIRAMTPTAEQAAGTKTPDTAVLIGANGYCKSGGSIQVSANTYTQGLYVNAGFAAAISLYEHRLGIDEAFQIRRQSDFAQISVLSQGLPEAYIGFEQTHDIAVGDSGIGLLNTSPYYTVNGQNHTISGLQVPLFAENNGTVENITMEGSALAGFAPMAAVNNGEIKNCVVRNAAVSTEGQNSTDTDCAGFVLSNSGSIENCSAQGSVVSASAAAGFVLTNDPNGRITDCSCSMSEVTGAEAAGFIFRNAGGVSGSFEGSVHGSGGAAGFAFDCVGSGWIDHSTAAIGSVSASAGNAAGFAMTASDYSSIQGCSVEGSANGSVSSANGNAAGFIEDNGGDAGTSAACSVNGITVQGASASGFFDVNSGSVRGNVSSAVILGGSAGSGFGGVNNGAVQNSTVSASIQGASGCGFVMQNSGSVADCEVLSGTAVSSYTTASGFADTNEGSIANCTVNGGVAVGQDGTQEAYGFARSEGTLTDCVSNAVLTGKTTYPYPPVETPTP